MIHLIKNNETIIPRETNICILLNGSITINLFHESPAISDEGGFGSAEGTDTDIDISFNVEVK